MTRIAIFTHDTYGLGHVRRCLHIVREFSERLPDSSILLITGSPASGAMRDLPDNADYLKIPTIVQTGKTDNRPPHLSIGAREIASLRKRIVRSTLDSFRPDLFLVDNFPLGSRKELLPTLHRLRELSIPAVLGLRDIVDRPEVVRATWTKEKIYDALREYYDLILVYGLPEILEVREAYGLPPEIGSKVRYCGYIASPRPPAHDPAEIRRELGLESPLVVATVGGGGDGFPLLSSFVQAVRQIPNISAVAVTGPLMASTDRQRIRQLAEGEGRIVVKDYVPDLPAYLAASDLVLAMGGYNTVAELLGLGRWALVLPRDWRYGEYAERKDAGREWEQLTRARQLERLGHLRVLSAESFRPEALRESIVGALEHGERRDVPRIEVDGVRAAVDQIVGLIDKGAKRVPV